MSDSKTAFEAEALRRAFLDAGLDPTGIDLDWMAEFRVDTEAHIAAGRADPAFATAKPFFMRFGPSPERGGDNGAS